MKYCHRERRKKNSDKFSDFYLILAPVNITKSKGNEDLAADVSALWLFIMDDFISQWCDKVKEGNFNIQSLYVILK